jgi:hypothetical protein
MIASPLRGGGAPSSKDGVLESNFFCASLYPLVTQSKNPLMAVMVRHLPGRADPTQRFETSAPHQGHETGDDFANAVSGMDRVV